MFVLLPNGSGLVGWMYGQARPVPRHHPRDLAMRFDVTPTEATTRLLSLVAQGDATGVVDKVAPAQPRAHARL